MRFSLVNGNCALAHSIFLNRLLGSSRMKFPVHVILHVIFHTLVGTGYARVCICQSSRFRDV